MQNKAPLQRESASLRCWITVSGGISGGGFPEEVGGWEPHPLAICVLPEPQEACYAQIAHMLQLVYVGLLTQAFYFFLSALIAIYIFTNMHAARIVNTAVPWQPCLAPPLPLDQCTC